MDLEGYPLPELLQLLETLTHDLAEQLNIPPIVSLLLPSETRDRAITAVESVLKLRQYLVGGLQCGWPRQRGKSLAPSRVFSCSQRTSQIVSESFLTTILLHCYSAVSATALLSARGGQPCCGCCYPSPVRKRVGDRIKNVQGRKQRKSGALHMRVVALHDWDPSPATQRRGSARNRGLEFFKSSEQQLFIYRRTYCVQRTGPWVCNARQAQRTVLYPSHTSQCSKRGQNARRREARHPGPRAKLRETLYTVQARIPGGAQTDSGNALPVLPLPETQTVPLATGNDSTEKTPMSSLVLQGLECCTEAVDPIDWITRVACLSQPCYRLALRKCLTPRLNFCTPTLSKLLLCPNILRVLVAWMPQELRYAGFHCVQHAALIGFLGSSLRSLALMEVPTAAGMLPFSVMGTPEHHFRLLSDATTLHIANRCAPLDPLPRWLVHLGRACHNVSCLSLHFCTALPFNTGSGGALWAGNTPRSSVRWTPPHSHSPLTECQQCPNNRHKKSIGEHHGSFPLREGHPTDVDRDQYFCRSSKHEASAVVRSSSYTVLPSLSSFEYSSISRNAPSRRPSDQDIWGMSSEPQTPVHPMDSFCTAEPSIAQTPPEKRIMQELQRCLEPGMYFFCQKLSELSRGNVGDTPSNQSEQKKSGEGVAELTFPCLSSLRFFNVASVLPLTFFLCRQRIAILMRVAVHVEHFQQDIPIASTLFSMSFAQVEMPKLNTLVLSTAPVLSTAALTEFLSQCNQFWRGSERPQQRPSLSLQKNLKVPMGQREATHPTDNAAASYSCNGLRRLFLYHSANIANAPLLRTLEKFESLRSLRLLSSSSYGSNVRFDHPSLTTIRVSCHATLLWDIRCPHLKRASFMCTGDHTLRCTLPFESTDGRLPVEEDHEAHLLRYVQSMTRYSPHLETVSMHCAMTKLKLTYNVLLQRCRRHI